MTTQQVIQDKTDEEIKEYHLKRLYELSLKSIGEIQQGSEPSYEQKEFIKRKIWRTNK